MRILLIHQYFLEKNEHGGYRWNEFARMWANEGHEVNVIAGMMHYNGAGKREQYKGKYFVQTEQDGVKVLRTHVSEAYNRNFIGRLWGYFSFMFSSTIGGLFYLNRRYDIVIVTSPPLFVGISGYLLSRFIKKPLVMEIRDLWPESAIDTGVLKSRLLIRIAFWVESFLYKKSNKINVLTPAFRKILIEGKDVPASKILYTPNSADFSISESLLETFDVKQFRRQLGWEDKFVVIYVGAHGVANALDQVLETALLLTDTPVLFALIGEGMQKLQLKAKAREMNLTNVEFLDPVPKNEVFKYILASQMGASVLQRNNTFKTVYSNKTFDYMSCKKPILMAIDGVSRELVEEAKAGVFVEPENPADFAAKVLIFMNDPIKLREYGENGYTYAKKNFDRINLAKKFISELQLIK